MRHHRFYRGMTFASAVCFLGFTLLISLGIFALGLVLAASVFALIAAGVDIVRLVSRWTRFGRRSWRAFGETGRQFVFCWAGFALCVALASANLFMPRFMLGYQTTISGFDLIGLALVFPAILQISERLGRKPYTHG